MVVDEKKDTREKEKNINGGGDENANGVDAKTKNGVRDMEEVAKETSHVVGNGSKNENSGGGEDGCNGTVTIASNIKKVLCFAGQYSKETGLIPEISSDLLTPNIEHESPSQSSELPPILSSPPSSTIPSFFLTPADEHHLIRFYASRIPSLIGPRAKHPPLRTQSRTIVGTSSLLFIRFYLSNSVLTHDPKITMVGAVLLASKVEDCVTRPGLLEEGAALMNANVRTADIVRAEMDVAMGCGYQLACHHPHNAVLAYTQDLRTFLKQGGGGEDLASFDDYNDNNDGNNDENSGTGTNKNSHHRPVVGNDLVKIHDVAIRIVNRAVSGCTDAPLLSSPGTVGLSAMVVANEGLLCEQKRQRRLRKRQDKEEEYGSGEEIPRIDYDGYVRRRFGGGSDRGDNGGGTTDIIMGRYCKGPDEIERVLDEIKRTCVILRTWSSLFQLSSKGKDRGEEGKDTGDDDGGKSNNEDDVNNGKYENDDGIHDMDELKAVHKKLKKCRNYAAGGTGETKEKKKKKKRKR